MDIDREMAEKVMGLFDDPIKSNVWVNEERSICMRKRDWHPSTNIFQAFQVVEKMGASVWQLKIKKSDGSDGYYVEIRKNRDVASGWAESNTIEMAICLAILEARGGR